jgi:hypothetical protein
LVVVGQRLLAGGCGHWLLYPAAPRFVERGTPGARLGLGRRLFGLA